MKELMDEFKAFLMKGNIIMLAVGLFMGAAFGELVTAITKGLIDPIIGKLPGMDGNLAFWTPGGIGIGLILSAMITFSAKAAVIFFVVVKPMNKLTSMMEKKAEETPAGAPPATLDDVVAALKELKK